MQIVNPLIDICPTPKGKRFIASTTVGLQIREITSLPVDTSSGVGGPRLFFARTSYVLALIKRSREDELFMASSLKFMQKQQLLRKIVLVVIGHDQVVWKWLSLACSSMRHCHSLTQSRSIKLTTSVSSSPPCRSSA